MTQQTSQYLAFCTPGQNHEVKQ